MKAAREAAGYTQVDLAKVLRVKQSTISRWESGGEKPLPALRDALEIVIGLPRAAWYTRDEAQLVKELRASARIFRRRRA